VHTPAEAFSRALRGGICMRVRKNVDFVPQPK
jgi:hypothetical protein